MNPMKSLPILKKWLWRVAVTLVISFSLLIIGLRASLLFFHHHQEDLETRVAAWLGQPITIGGVKAGWRGFGPQFSLTDITILDVDSGKPLIRAKELVLHLSLWDSLWKRQFELNKLSIRGAAVTLVQQPDGSVLLRGMTSSAPTSLTGISGTLDWLFSQDHIFIGNSHLVWCRTDNDCLRIRDIDLQLTNQGSRHHLSGHASYWESTPTGGRPSGFSFVTDIQGNIHELEALEVESYFYLQDLNIFPWFPEIELFNWTQLSSQLSLELWASWREKTLQHVQSRFRLDNLTLLDELGSVVAQARDWSGNLWWQPSSDGWVLQGYDWHLSSGNHDPRAQWVLSHQQASAEPQWIFHAKDFLIDNFSAVLLQGPWARDWSSSVRELRPRGLLEHVVFEYSDQALQEPHWYLSGAFNDAGVGTASESASLLGLQGDFIWENGRGLSTFNSDHVQFISQSVFNRPLIFNDFTGEIEVSESPQGVSLFLKAISTELEGLFLSGEGLLSFPTGSDPLIVLDVDFYSEDVRPIKSYMPVNVMEAGLVMWLEDAIIAGEVTKGVFTWDGPLTALPYKDDEGLFEIRFDAEEAILQVDKNWPIIQDIKGHFHLNPKLITVTAEYGNIYGNTITYTQVHVDIPYDQDAFTVRVEGSAHGDLSDGLNFLAYSPLQMYVKRAQDQVYHGDLVASGDMAVNLSLYLPFFSEEEAVVSGNVSLSESRLDFRDWLMDVNHVSGNIGFSETSIFGKSLSGKLWNNPIQIDIVPQKVSEGSRTTVNVSGVVDHQILEDRWPQPQGFWSSVSGSPNYLAQIIFEPLGSKTHNRLVLSSTLQGVTIDLPQPYGKFSESVAPLTIEFPFHPPENKTIERTQVMVDYNNILSAAMQWERSEYTNFENTFSSGHIFLGEGLVTIPAQPGLLISGSVPHFSWELWEPVVDRIQSYHADHIDQDVTQRVLREIDVRIQELTAKGYQWPNTHLNITRHSDYWLFALDGESLHGEVSYPDDLSERPVIADFEKFYGHKNKEISGESVSDSDSIEESKEKDPFNPSEFPSLLFTCADCRLNDRDLGSVELQLTPDDEGLAFERFIVQGPTSIEAVGYWGNPANESPVTFEGQFETEDVGDAFESFQLKPLIMDSRAQGDFFLHWSGGLNNPNLSTLEGNFKLNMQEGRIPDIETGPGRLLGLFSLDSLIRRLQLDFSDLYQKGLAFDTLSGSFQVESGRIHTDDMQLQGPAARVQIAGETNVAEQNYDAQIVFMPYISSAAPIAATVVAGPVIGAAFWALETVARPLLGHATAIRYNVSGSWADPQLERLEG